MRTKIGKRIISIFVVAFLIAANMGQAYASSISQAANPAPKEQKGKYYGKTVEAKEKVKEVKQDEKKAQPALKQPKVNAANQGNNSKYKKEQEAKEKRTPNSKTFNVGKGQSVSLVYLEKIHYKDADGNLQDIDNTLVQDGERENEAYANKANDFKARFPANIGKGTSIKIAKEEAALELIPVEGDFSRSAAKENAILYNDVFQGIDYQYTVLNSKVKEDIILNHFVDRNTFDFEVDAKGLTLKEENGAIFGYEKGSKVPSWTLSAPYMEDAGGTISEKVAIHLEKKWFGKDRITITADKEWLAAKDRAYPVRIDPTVTIGSESISDTTAEEGAPDTITNNAYSYIGYDDGIVSGNLEDYDQAHLKTRTFLRFDLPDIGEDQLIESANLSLYRYTHFSEEERTIELHRVNASVDNISAITWNNQPMDVSFEASAQIAADLGYVSWDIKDLMNSWYSGSPNNGIVLKYENERQQCEVFASSDNPDFPKPYVEIAYKDKGTIDPDLPLDAPTIHLRPLVKSNNDGMLQFAALSADGFSRPDSEVEYKTVPDNELGFGGQVIASHDYDYPALPFIEWVPDKYTSKESNWQTDMLFSPELDKLYHIEAVARYEGPDESGNMQIKESPAAISDTFQIYQVKDMDIFSRVLTFYGITDKATFMKDNNMTDGVLVQNNIIFIRNPKQNAGKPYTPDRPLNEEEKRRIDDLLMSRGKHCVYDFEPINLMTGNFYYNTADVSIPDYGGEFTISRTYNAMSAYYKGPFGLRWDFEFNKFIAYMADGSKVFDRGDGSRIYFDKGPDGTYKAPVGEIYTLEENGQGFKVEQKDQMKYYFRKSGLLTAVEDRNGNRTTLNYDENDKLNAIVSPSGKLFMIDADNEGRITAIRLPNHSALK